MDFFGLVKCVVFAGALFLAATFLLILGLRRLHSLRLVHGALNYPAAIHWR